MVGLSIDFSDHYEKDLRAICKEVLKGDLDVHSIDDVLSRIPDKLPSIRFGIETALLDLKHGGKRKIVDCDFYDRNIPIPINGLVWMGEKDFMLRQIKEKLAQGYDTIKIKVGAIDHPAEIGLLGFIRKQFPPSEISIRLDANGAYSEKDVFEKLNDFARFEIHSIEQPVKQGQPELMKEVCEKSPIPIALDEELIGVFGKKDQEELLSLIRPAYIILKPSLVGGLAASAQWIEIAERLHIGWWMTSLLESNIGLNAIAQFTSSMKASMPQGLGTGQLYHNNIDSPLEVEGGRLVYRKDREWGIDF